MQCFFGMTNADISNVPPTPSLPQLLFLSTMPCGMGHPYGQSGSAVLSVFPPNYLWSSSPLWQGSTSSRKVLGSVQHCSKTTRTLCVIKFVFLLKLKHTIIPDTVKKNNSILAETKAIAFNNGGQIKLLLSFCLFNFPFAYPGDILVLFLSCLILPPKIINSLFLPDSQLNLLVQ